MRVITFSDIHANIHALEAVLADLAQHRADQVVCLGDLVGYGAFPNEVISRLRELGILTIQGNYDDGVGYDKDDCGCAYREEEEKQRGQRSLLWHRERVTAENKAFLRGLLPRVEYKVGDSHVVLVHGSPRKTNEYLFQDRLESSVIRLMDLAKADILVCGHTHLPYHRILSDGRHVINDGSVGKPKDGDPRACYAIIDIDNGKVGVQFPRVEYDVEAAARAIEESGLPAEFAQHIRMGVS